MSEDIVTRLRDWASCSLDRGRVDASKDFTEAADTIETLRAERDEANTNAKLYRDDRDEARRMVCTVESALIGGRKTQRAQSHGWDCFDVGVIDGKP
jgi:hypothetical protein